MSGALTLSQAETARLFGMSARRFSNDLPTLINEGFPPPYIGNLSDGRNGPRRRWLRRAVLQFMTLRSVPGEGGMTLAANENGDGLHRLDRITLGEVRG